MSVKKGIDTTRKLYVEKIYNLLKNRQKNTYTDTKVWSLLELAHNRGFYLGDALLSGIDNGERLIDMRGHIDALLDFVSPVEVCILLVGSNQLKQNGKLTLEKSGSVYNGINQDYLPLDPLSEKKYNCPSETMFFVGHISDEVDPQNVQVGETLESKRDYEIIQNRRDLWRGDCSVIFNAVWRDSIEWGHLLNIGFKDVSNMNFSDHGVNFISEVLIKAQSRGFAYQSFFVNEIPLSDGKSELSDCFTAAILLFVAPSELYQMLDLSLEFGVGKYSKPHDPKRVKMKG